MYFASYTQLVYKLQTLSIKDLGLVCLLSKFNQSVLADEMLILILIRFFETLWPLQSTQHFVKLQLSLHKTNFEKNPHW